MRRLGAMDAFVARRDKVLHRRLQPDVACDMEAPHRA